MNFADPQEMVITMSTLDDSVIAQQWLIRYNSTPGQTTLHVYAAHAALECRDGTVHAASYTQCP